MVLGLCRQFHCLPGALYEEDVELIQLLNIESRGTPEGGADDGQ
jgi:hypothetical protein